MECSSEVVEGAYAHAHIKGGWPGQMRFKIAGKFKPRQTSCIISQRITGITQSQSEYILGVADEYNPRHV